MTKKFNKVRLGLILVLVIIFYSFVNIKNDSLTVKADDQTVKPYATPTSDPIVFLGIWFSNGYSLQPETDYYTQVGQSIVVHTSASRSIWTVLTGPVDSPHYRWYKSTDYGENWSSVSESDGGHRMNFPITPKSSGTTWYQLDTQYYTLLTPYLKTHIYSKVTAVHVKDPVNATSLKVSADNKYIYNESDSDLSQNYTFIHAYPTPTDATGKITYSVDKPEIANFEEDTENGGTTNKLIAKSGAVGTVRVTAKMQNPDGSTTSGYTDVRVGGGLDDQTVDVGQSATFSMHGNIDGTNSNTSGSIQIKWYKYDKDGNKTTVATSNSSNYKDYVDYTIPKTTMDDNGTQYQAQITVSLLGFIQTDSLTTNKATLTVKNNPDLSISTKVINNTYDDGSNTSDTLNKVTNNDNISYEFNLKNNNKNSILTNGSYVVPVHKGTLVNNVELDGKEVDSDNYTVYNSSDKKESYIIINGIDFNENAQSHSLKIDATVSGVTDAEKFESVPYYYGDDYGGSVYQESASKHTINYVNDKFNAAVNDISFGTIKDSQLNKVYYRQDDNNLPNSTINISDQRRDKKAMKVLVSESKPLGDGMTLRYYQNDDYTNLSNSDVLIKSFDQDNISSIGWKKDEGILLYIGNTLPTAGKYSTELHWTFEDSI
ncbi:hypothetical protein [Companilactobacillus bobalius]|uniref:Cell surface SD repeat-containing protein n=2 Tax=Companilactobacillus bobalius TaxID=2801451 RepID=A0A202F840_9LACO|nr:hypothetical protein [Companilactobacillus bobalius]GEO58410.1 hypothetical protein LBO01_15390 [Companilactobacillus paralimentarius]KAE9557636.1 hypothetical protein ATN92_15915 [Companilactobacillus bobalius]KAE9563782.1 hypothetical protein ATN92_03365 [Companilactobacillus bobalius]KRK83530.1 cell surface SD repeat-containing protein [Companilactobacillus bobalius DSM 19674]OVE96613.1 hypothetical protein LKACC16343_02282 [Companilactobacillus bobalius]